MLRLRLSFEDRETAPPRWTDAARAWHCGLCTIEPYRHRVVESHGYRAGERSLFVVRENPRARRAADRLDPVADVDDATLDAKRAEAAAWDGNVVAITLDHARRTVEIASGPWGSAPLYATAKDGVLRADWNASRLYPYLSGSVDLGRAVYSLIHIGYPYSRQTIFPDLAHLTERSVATWSPTDARVAVRYPSALPRVMPRTLREGADVPAAFGQVLRDAVSRWATPGVTLGTQLSGGIDSSVVAVALASLEQGPVHTYGLIMPGRNGEFQAARRRELIARFGFVDVTLPGADYPPYSADHLRARDGSVVPWDEFYYDAMGALLDRVRADGLDVLFTGMGGDELSTLMLHEEEPRDVEEEKESPLPPFLTPRGMEAYQEAIRLQEPAPRPGTETSCAESAATNAGIFLSKGLWPAYPYCDPKVVAFTRSLPATWRADRDFQRGYLRQAGCSEEVADPDVVETFADIMTQGLRQGDRLLRPLFEASVLAQEGLLDRDALLAAYGQFQTTGRQTYKDALAELAMIELSIRALRLASPRDVRSPEPVAAR
jgi:asparagine synthase (glutamine-hydrolysing)